jgi:hypothetical protein
LVACSFGKGRELKHFESKCHGLTSGGRLFLSEWPWIQIVLGAHHAFLFGGSSFPVEVVAFVAGTEAFVAEAEGFVAAPEAS